MHGYRQRCTVHVTVSSSLSDSGKDLMNAGAARRKSAYGIVHK